MFLRVESALDVRGQRLRISIDERRNRRNHVTPDFKRGDARLLVRADVLKGQLLC